MAALARASGMGAGQALSLLREHPRTFDSLWWSYVRPPAEPEAPCDIDAILAGRT